MRNFLIITGVKNLSAGNQSFRKNIAGFFKIANCDIVDLRKSKLIEKLKKIIGSNKVETLKSNSSNNEIKGPKTRKKLKFSDEVSIRNDKSQWFISLPAILFYLPEVMLSVLRNKKKYDLIVGYEISGVIVGFIIKKFFYKSANIIGIFQGTALPIKINGPMHLNFIKNIRHYPLDLLAWLMPLNGVIVTNDGTNGKLIAQYFNYKEEQIFFETNGVDYARIGLDREESNEHKISSNFINFVCSMRLVQWKRIDRIVELSKNLKLCQKLNNFKIFIIGDGPELENLEDLSRINAVDDCIEFLGKKSYDDSINIIKKCDYVITSSDVSNLNNLVLDSLALGMPLIAIDSGSLASFITDYGIEERVFIISPKDEFKNYEEKLHEFIFEKNHSPKVPINIISVEKREELLCDWLQKNFL